MKYRNSNVFAAFILAIVLSVFGTLPVNADDNGFTLEDAMRYQIFQELKANVEHLYQNSNLLVPQIDITYAARIAGENTPTGFALPANVTGKNSDSDKNRLIN